MSTTSTDLGGYKSCWQRRCDGLEQHKVVLVVVQYSSCIQIHILLLKVEPLCSTSPTKAGTSLEFGEPGCGLMAPRKLAAFETLCCSCDCRAKSFWPSLSRADKVI